MTFHLIKVCLSLTVLRTLKYKSFKYKKVQKYRLLPLL